MADAYWIGQDGNVWYKGIQGVQNWGSAKNYQFSDEGIKGGLNTPLGQGAGFAYASRIDDPALQGGSSAPSGGGGSPAPQLNEAGIRNTQLAIDQFPSLLRDALAVESRRYQNALADFEAQEKGQRKTYGESTNTNQLNYDSNFMDSIRAGIKGLGGLVQLLRGTGASGGTAEDQVKDVVGGVTAQDIRTGADTQKENQTSLDNVLGTFLTDLERKRRVNKDTFENNERAVRRDSLTQLQDLYGKMAGFYGDADRQAEYNTWMDKAGSLTPKIATNSRTQLSKYDTTPVAVKAPELTAFAGPTQPNILAAPGEGQVSNGRVGSGIFTISDRRRDREQVPAGV